MGVTEIAEQLGMYKSTVHRILSTLEKRGYIEKNLNTNKYWLGIKLFTLGMLYSKNMKLIDIARPFVEDLSTRFRETVHLSVLDFSEKDPKVVVIDKVQTDQFLVMAPPVGASSPAYCSAMGKSLLAYLETEELKKIYNFPLQKFTNNTITDFEGLAAELKGIKEKGYALDNEELEIGLTCVAAPIFNFEGRAIASISISGPSTRFKPIKNKEIADEVSKTARKISEKIS